VNLKYTFLITLFTLVDKLKSNYKRLFDIIKLLISTASTHHLLLAKKINNLSSYLFLYERIFLIALFKIYYNSGFLHVQKIQKIEFYTFTYLIEKRIHSVS